MRLGSKVFVATDLSESADEAIRQGHAWAARAKGELIVCHVVPTVLGRNMLFPHFNQPETQVVLDLEKRAADALEERVVELTGRKPSDFTIVVDNGSPDSEILGSAEENEASMIVVSSRGLTGVERLLLGSVAERVVRYAHCPVLVARPHEKTHRILAATDFSDPSLPAVELAGEMSRSFGMKATILHSLDIIPSPVVGFTVPFGGTAIAPPPEVLTKAREGVASMLKDLVEQYDVKGDYEVIEGNPGPSIVQAAEDHNADLVIMGTRGRTGLPRLAFGSVAETVVRNAHCSVLIVRAE